MDPIFDGYTPPDDEADRDEGDGWWVPARTQPCPDGDPQRLCQILGFRLKGEDLLQLRVVLCDFDNGVCQAVVDEQPDCIRVRVVACIRTDEIPLHQSPAPSEMDCPVRVWLDEPLGPRPIIDLDTGEELPLFLPRRNLNQSSRYVPRPPGDVWPPLYLEDFEENGS